MKCTFERYCFNTPVGFIRAMKKAGYNLITLANNHCCMDRDEEGIIKVSQKNLVETGRCFYRAFSRYVAECERKIPLVKR